MLDKLKHALSWLRTFIITYPAAIAGAVGATLAYAVSQGLVTWSPDQVAVIGGVVTAALAAAAGILTDQFGVALLIAFGNALAAAILGFSTSLPAHQVAVWIGVATFVLGFVHHDRNSPKYGPRGTQPAVQGVSAQLASPLPAPPVLQAPWLEPQPEPAQEPVSVPVAASVTRPATVAPDTGDEKQRRASAAAKKGWETRRRKTQDPALS